MTSEAQGQQEVVIIGGGGHTKVVIDLILDLGLKPVCVVSNRSVASYRGVPTIAGDGNLRFLAEIYSQAVIAIGLNSSRILLAQKAHRAGFEFTTLLSVDAKISPTSTIGRGSIVMNGSVINADTQIGAHCIINTSASVDHDCNLSDGVHIGPGARLAGSVTVDKLSFIGAGAVIVPGIKIGARSVVGAGAVVIRDVGDDQTVVGVPAANLRKRGTF